MITTLLTLIAGRNRVELKVALWLPKRGKAMSGFADMFCRVKPDK
jgi:hypothetical protein